MYGGPVIRELGPGHRVDLSVRVAVLGGGSDGISTRTTTGVRRLVVVLSPSWPYVLAPQHLTPPAVVRAHVCTQPAPTAATPLLRSLTATGVKRVVVVLSPS